MRTRLNRLAQRVEARTPLPDGDLVELWLPANPRDPRPPGRYPMPGGKAVLVIYDTLPSRGTEVL